MEISSIISKIKGCLLESIPAKDPRAKIQPLEFVTSLISSFSNKDGRVKSLSAMRKEVMAITGVKVSRGTFWERMATKRLRKFILLLLCELMTEICV